MRLLHNAVSLIDFRQLAVSRQTCTLCGFPLLVRLSATDIGVRCLRCRASSVHMAMAGVIRQAVHGLSSVTVYELSSRGALVRFLKKEAGELVVSEYLDDGEPGQLIDGVECQNVEALTYRDGRFDLCTSTDVFEHVADDCAGFAELYRVLRPGGWLIFTVPLSMENLTVERARRTLDGIEHLMEPEYHGDALRGPGKVLAFRNYGRDITARLEAAGFSAAQINLDFTTRFMGAGRAVVMAKKVRM